MKIYIVMIADRHCDTEPFPFVDADKAIAHARQQAVEYATDEIEEEQIDGWLYYARYSGEGDSIWVVEKDLDGAVPAVEAPEAKTKAVDHGA